MTAERLSTTPNGEPTVDVLIEAYKQACYPTPFRDGDTTLADTVRGRIAVVRFSPYWSTQFQDWRDNFNGNPAGFFASRIFQAAETQDGDQLLLSVATELADKHGAEMLEADLDVPEVKGVEFVSQELGSVANFLAKLRQDIEGYSVPLSPQPRCISDGWIAFTHILASSDPDNHNGLFAEITAAYADTDVWTEREMEFWDGMMGGFNSWNRNYAILREAIAIPLARHFPDIVVSSLQKPSQLYVWNASSLPPRRKDNDT